MNSSYINDRMHNILEQKAAMGGERKYTKYSRFRDIGSKYRVGDLKGKPRCKYPDPAGEYWFDRKLGCIPYSKHKEMILAKPATDIVSSPIALIPEEIVKYSDETYDRAIQLIDGAERNLISLKGLIEDQYDAMPKYGPENMPMYGPENMPIYGPADAMHGPLNMPIHGPYAKAYKIKSGPNKGKLSRARLDSYLPRTRKPRN